MSRIVRTGGFKAVKAFYAELGSEYVKAFNDMLVLDAVILNADRHYGNFGFLVDSNSRYNLDSERLTMLEKIIGMRAAELLK